MEKCVFSDVCKKPECNFHTCLRYNEFYYLIETSNVPVKKIRPENLKLIPEEVDLQTFNELKTIKDNIINFVNSGNNLYLYSNRCGNGKTTWALKLLMSYFNKIWIGNGFRPRGLFINVPKFMNDLRNNITLKNEKTENLKKLIPLVDIVVWDDIGAVNIKEYDHLVLLSYIDERVLEGKCNIYTGNLGGPNLEKVLGQRLFSRVYNNSINMELFGADRRLDGHFTDFE